MSSYNNFNDQPLIPYAFVQVLLQDNSEACENFWKCLKYATTDALDNDNLTLKEKRALIWDGKDSEEENYNLFLKPLMPNSMETALEHQQVRIFRPTTVPDTSMKATICIEADFLTNEKTSMVYYKGVLCERTDILESLFLEIFNGRDIKIGSGVVGFDRTLTRNCGSNASISNSKSFFGRSLIVALHYVNVSSENGCK